MLVRAELANPHEAILPGESAEAHAVTSGYHEAIVVPAVAVRHSPAGSVIYVVDDESRVAAVGVQTTDAEEGFVAIDRALPPGARVVVNGADLVLPGMLVKITEQTSRRPPKPWPIGPRAAIERPDSWLSDSFNLSHDGGRGRGHRRHRPRCRLAARPTTRPGPDPPVPRPDGSGGTGAAENSGRDEGVNFVHGAGIKKRAKHLAAPFDQDVRHPPVAELGQQMIEPLMARLAGTEQNLTTGIA